MAVSIHDYLIDHSRFDWPSLLADWAWLLPRELTAWLVNRFGDLFAVLGDGSVWRLNIEGGTFERLAESRQEFGELLGQENNANDWLMIPLVDDCVAAGLALEPERCYSFKIPPVLGADYVVENVGVVPIHELYGAYASIHQQIKDLPDGTPISLKVIGVPPRE